MDKKVVKIEINNRCLYSYPCHHKCTIHYDDNSQESELLNGVTIIQNYFEFLSDLDKEHFKEYVNFYNIN